MTYNWTVIWNGRLYDSSQVSIEFIVWLVKNDQFTLKVEGEIFQNVRLDRDGFWFRARVDEAETGTVGCAHSRHGFDKALTYLIENLSESILSKQTC